MRQLHLNKVKELIKLGFTEAEIGIHPAKYRRATGYVGPLSDIAVQHIAELDKPRLDDLAIRFRCSKSMIAAARRGLTSKYNTVTDTEIYDLFRLGYNRGQIIEELGCAPRVVPNLKTDNGKAIRLKYRELGDQRDVASFFGISQACVSYHCETKVHKPNSIVDEETWDIILANAHYLTVTELAKKYKVSRAAIYSRRKMSPDRKRVKRITDAMWAEMQASGLTYSAMAREYSVSRNAIYRRLKHEQARAIS